MGKRQLVVLIVIIILTAGAWLAFGRNKNSPAGGGRPTPSSIAPSQTPQSQAPVTTDKVEIADMAFSPSDITVKKGTTVTWTNQDSVAHTVTENDGKNGPSAPPLDQGKSYSFTFNEAGTFHYHCSLHPQMTGTVTVTE